MIDISALSEPQVVTVHTAGPQGVRGAQGWVWQGPWDIATDYHAETLVGGVVTVGADAVSHDGSAWLAVADSTGVEPSALAAEWEQIAEKGEPTTLTVTATTLPVGEPATAVISGDAPAQAIAFGLPTGATGATGATGPANSLTVGTVTTTDPGTDAAATITGTPPSQTLDLSIPRGAAGLGVGTLGNLLTAAQATPTTGQYTLSGATEAAGLVLTASGSAAYSAYATVASVVAGQTWTAMATLAPVGRACATRISWRNSGGAEISAVAGDSIAAGATGASMAVGVAPAGAVSVRAFVAYAGTGTTGDRVTVTRASFHGGAGGEWVAPGVPVPNLGQRYNSTEGSVEVWQSSDSTWKTVVYRALVGNLLTANQAACGSDGTTSGFTASASTLAVITSGADEGSSCIRVTATGAASSFYVPAGNFSAATFKPVYPGATVTAFARLRADTPPANPTAILRVYWFDSAGNGLGSNYPTSTATVTTSWTTATGTVVAPANAAYMTLRVYLGAGVEGDVWQVDRLGLWAGAGGDWAMPGTPITNLGRRVTHPNTDDILIQTWDSTTGAWATARYDSGVRDVSSLLVNGWAVATADGRFLISRTGNMVTLTAHISAAGKTSDIVAAIPAGFRPAHNQYWSAITNVSTGSIGGGMYCSPVSTFAAYTFTGNGYATSTWYTNNAIPTSLPGALVSAAPA